MAIIANSGRFEVNGLDMQAIGRSALDGAISLLFTALPLLAGAHYMAFGHDITAVVLFGLTLVVKGIRKWITDHNLTQPPVGPFGSSN